MFVAMVFDSFHSKKHTLIADVSEHLLVHVERAVAVKLQTRAMDIECLVCHQVSDDKLVRAGFHYLKGSDPSGEQLVYC
ncbi:hypothetical protein PF004_g33083 [Phytophthora fragariae]|uniref:Uncharacterized protein n=1 Tax=Phytophthora fragariae TaxID=53985 RepID=A0A6A3D9D1_9STRA|nr:hypothetical protein PF009_g33477 [Phytophthora fragariae]KAE9144277.1 hypothetical protein PF004_g33083 [Phytophthora fragariae]